MSLLTPPLTPEVDSHITTPLSKRGRDPLPIANATALFTPPYTPEQKDSRPSSQDFSRLSFQSAGEVDERRLSDNELSYYLPSRADGVNDMYLHHRLTAPASLLTSDRVLHLWALLLLRHPLLSSSIRQDSYTDISFVHSRPTSVLSALTRASERFSHVELSAPESATDLIDTYLNGERTLSKDILSYLFIQGSASSWEVMLCATHFLGDGMALHTFMNEFYTLLSSPFTTTTTLAELIRAELALDTPSALPLPLEQRLPPPTSRLAEAVGADEYPRSEKRLVGGQGFPGNPVKGMGRKTLVPTFAYTEAETKAILGACKANGVTIAHAVFALCNIAWSRLTSSTTDPSLIYSALNLRPQMTPLDPKTSAESGSRESYFHLAVGYFNIVLPTLVPAGLTTEELFWHRARMTKAQTIRAVKSPFLISRSQETSKIRAARAIKWAAIDDEEEARKSSGAAGQGLGLGIQLPARSEPAKETPKIAPPTPAPAVPSGPNTPTPAAVSQKALMGLSMLGNLDGMYNHKAFGDIRLTSLTTGSRQRPGALLLFAYTFAGKLWMSLGYDVNGFKPGAIEAFWEEVQKLVKEVML